MLLTFRLVVSKRANKGISVYTDSSQLLEEILELQNWWCNGKSTSHIKNSVRSGFLTLKPVSTGNWFLCGKQLTIEYRRSEIGRVIPNSSSFSNVRNLESTSSMTSWMSSSKSPYYSSEFCSCLFVKSNTHTWMLKIFEYRLTSQFDVCNILQSFESSYCISTQIF